MHLEDLPKSTATSIFLSRLDSRRDVEVIWCPVDPNGKLALCPAMILESGVDERIMCGRLDFLCSASVDGCPAGRQRHVKVDSRSSKVAVSGSSIRDLNLPKRRGPVTKPSNENEGPDGVFSYAERSSNRSSARDLLHHIAIVRHVIPQHEHASHRS